MAKGKEMEKTILVVDDDVSVRNTFEKVFLSAGYRVYCVESGEDALNILQQGDIQVGFVDLNLPAMSGVDLCKRVREENMLKIVYAVTGYMPLVQGSDFSEFLFDGCLTKPVDLSTLLTSAEKAFNSMSYC